MKIEIKKLYKDSKLPTKAHIEDACFDLYAHSLNEESYYDEYKTGIAINIPANHVGLLFPRSSISNYSLYLANAVGIIDSGYLGELSFRFKDQSDYEEKKYEIGDRIGQILIIPIPEVDFKEVEHFMPTRRGTNGYGSSGK